MRKPTTCGACGQVGHNRRTCKSPVQRPAEGRKKVRYDCARCQRAGHKAADCTTFAPMVRLEDGTYSVKPDLLVVVVSRRYTETSATAVPGYQMRSKARIEVNSRPTYDLIVYGDGSVRTYVRDNVDVRLTLGSGPLPWCEDGIDMDAHFDKVKEGESAPVQLALGAAVQLFSESRFDVPTWDEDEL